MAEVQLEERTSFPAVICPPVQPVLNKGPSLSQDELAQMRADDDGMFIPECHPRYELK